jgi:serine/threonine protein phosphatase PrpC
MLSIPSRHVSLQEHSVLPWFTSGMASAQGRRVSNQDMGLICAPLRDHDESHEQRLEHRQGMGEERKLIPVREQCHFFGVFDGHGTDGRQISDLASSMVELTLRQLSRPLDPRNMEYLKERMLTIDDVFCKDPELQKLEGGTTMAFMVMQQSLPDDATSGQEPESKVDLQAGAEESKGDAKRDETQPNAKSVDPDQSTGPIWRALIGHLGDSRVVLISETPVEQAPDEQTTQEVFDKYHKTAQAADNKAQVDQQAPTQATSSVASTQALFTIVETVDHAPHNAEETLRIVRAGRDVAKDLAGMWRITSRPLSSSGKAPVSYGLNVSRGFADRAYKDRDELKATEQAVSAECKLQYVTLKPGDVVMIACDGFWEKHTGMTTQKWAVRIGELRRKLFIDGTSRTDWSAVGAALIQESINGRSGDNHTIILVECLAGADGGFSGKSERPVPEDHLKKSVQPRLPQVKQVHTVGLQYLPYQRPACVDMEHVAVFFQQAVAGGCDLTVVMDSARRWFSKSKVSAALSLSEQRADEMKMVCMTASQESDWRSLQSCTYSYELPL